MKTFNIIKEQLQYNRLMQPNTKKAEQNHTLKGQTGTGRISNKNEGKIQSSK